MSFRKLFDVCDSPTYVEAREVKSQYDWVGSSNKLTYPINPNSSTTSWGMGISTAIGYELVHSKFRFLTYFGSQI